MYFFKKEILLFLILGVICNLAGADSRQNTLKLKYLQSSPKIDGNFEVGEWNDAFKISGGNPHKLEPRRCEFYAGADKKFLYFAVRSEMPPNDELIASAQKGQSGIRDDSVEVWIAPPVKERAGNLKFGYFQLIANFKDFVWGQQHNPGYGLPVRIWLSHAKTASQTSQKYWIFEMKIPASSFGLKNIPTKQLWHILMVRNFKSPWMQAAWSKASHFNAKELYLPISFSDSGCSSQLSYSGSSRVPSILKIVNRNGKDEKIKISATVNGQQLKTEQNVKSGGSIDFSWGKLVDSKKKLKIDVNALDSSGAIIFSRKMLWLPISKKIWQNLGSEAIFYEKYKGKCSGKVKGEIEYRKDKDMARESVYLTKGASIQYPSGVITLPISISCNIQIGEKFKNVPKANRRYWSTAYRGTGYIFIQQLSKSSILFGFHHFRDAKGKKSSKNMIVSFEPKPGIWYNFTVNIFEKRAEFYINGIKRGSTDFNFKIDAAKLGGLRIGGCVNDFSMDGISVYKRPLSVEEIKSLVLGDKLISGKISYFPSLKSLVLDSTFTLKKLPADAKVNILVKKASDNKLIDKYPVKLSGTGAYRSEKLVVLHKIIKADKLKAGHYICSLQVTSKSTPTANVDGLSREITIKDYPWLHNKLGMSKLIVPPFTAIKVSENNLSCILRDYQIGKTGLPKQIKAKGKNILAAPITYHALSKGKELKWQSTGINISKKDKTQVKYSALNKSKVLNVRIDGEFEYDGMLKLSFNIKPNKTYAEINQFYINIPLKKEFAKLYHAAGVGVRINPAGKLPQGQGCIWNSRLIPQMTMENFIPYVWIGDELRGISYVADKDRDWQHCKKRDAVELHRDTKGNVSIRINLLNGPLKLGKARKIVLAVMATPVKPMPKDWRAWSDNASVLQLPGRKFLQCLYSNYYWGCYYGWMGRYPDKQRFEYFKKLTEAKNTGKVDYKYIKTWVNSIDCKDKHAKKKSVSGHTISAFNMMRGLNKYKEKSLFYIYTCMTDKAVKLPEYEVFRDEWEYKNRMHTQKSVQDYSLYYFNKLFDCGLGGIYFDNTFLVNKFAWPTGEGWIDSKGNIRPSAGIWRSRQYIKRVATLMVERGMEPFLCLHNTNTTIYPTMSFATNTMGMEWKYGNSDFQERYTPAYIRTVNLGKQGGFFPTAIGGITNCKGAKKTWATRTMLAMLCPHEIQPTCTRWDAKIIRKLYQIIWDFGKAEPDTEFLPYWDAKNLIKVSDKGLLVSAYKRGKKLLLICSDYKSNSPVKITFDLKKFRFDKIKSAKNAETGEKISFNFDNINLLVKKHDIALIEVQF
jgi:hypothetical protein